MWNHLSSQYVAYGSYFDDVMRTTDQQRPRFLPPLYRSAGLFIASDFSGSHTTSRFNTLSFVIAPRDDYLRWNRERRVIRQDLRLSNRRIAYSKLNDAVKKRAMPYFVDAANRVRGLSITVLIDKQVKSLFGQSYIDPEATIVGGRTFSGRKSAVVERLLHAVYLVALFVAGVSSPKQDILWVTDEDEIAPDEKGLEELTRVFGCVLSSIIPHPLGYIRVGTTKTATRPGDNLMWEDFASIADLIAGSVNDFICAFGPDIPLTSFVTLAPPSLPEKTRDVVVQLFDENANLRKIIFIVEAVNNSASLRYGSSQIALQPHIVAPAAG